MQAAGKLELSDALLLEGVQRGEEEAFSVLFRRYWETVHAVLFRVVGDGQEAEDLAQEVFLRLYRRPPANRGGPGLPAWLYRVALNLGYNALRARYRRQKREGKAALTSPAPDPAQEAVLAEEREVVRQVLAQLPSRYQACLGLRYHGLSYAEIAQVLGVKTNSVGTLLARAEVQFKRLYKE